MSAKYFPYTEYICHHVYNKGGCTFCGFHLMKKCVSPRPVSDAEMIGHFDEFIADEKNRNDILKEKRLSVETEGSWFLEVPRVLRRHICRFIESHALELHTQCRATLIDRQKTCAALTLAMRVKDGLWRKIKSPAEISREVFRALDTELRPYMLISTGLEVADDADLKLVNKGCELDDYIAFSRFIRAHGAKLAANVLIAPPLVADPIRKALKTARFAFDVLKAEEIAILSCIPRVGSKGNLLWKQGRWNPISATESAEIFHVVRENYPDKKIRLDTMRVHFFHGKYGPKVRTEKQKVTARKIVRKIAEEVF